MIRYQLGFPDPDSKCVFVDRNPGFHPVVEVGGSWGFGRVVALCDSKFEAQRIVDLLNAHGMKT